MCTLFGGSGNSHVTGHNISIDLHPSAKEYADSGHRVRETLLDKVAGSRSTHSSPQRRFRPRCKCIPARRHLSHDIDAPLIAIVSIGVPLGGHDATSSWNKSLRDSTYSAFSFRSSNFFRPTQSITRMAIDSIRISNYSSSSVIDPIERSV